MKKCIKGFEIGVDSSFDDLINDMRKASKKYKVDIELVVNTKSLYPAFNVIGSELNILKFLQKWYFDYKTIEHTRDTLAEEGMHFENYTE